MFQAGRAREDSRASPAAVFAFTTNSFLSATASRSVFGMWHKKLFGVICRIRTTPAQRGPSIRGQWSGRTCAGCMSRGLCAPLRSHPHKWGPCSALRRAPRSHIPLCCCYTKITTELAVQAGLWPDRVASAVRPSLAACGSGPPTSLRSSASCTTSTGRRWSNLRRAD